MDVGGHFLRMMNHGAGDRGGGAVILSQLPEGRSQIAARAPSVKFVLRGEETYTIAGRCYRVGPGEFILVEAGVGFDVRTSDGSIGLCIYLPVDEGDDGDTASEMGTPVIGGTRLDPFSKLLNSYAVAMKGEPEEAANLAAPLLSQAQNGSMAFLARFASTQRQLRQTKPATRTEILRRLERARSYIHENSYRRLSLDEIAREAALSRFHLAHTFCEAYGRGPLAYHRSLRLKDAATKLGRGLASATELAEQLEYAFPSAFTRAFKAEFGVSPSTHARETSRFATDAAVGVSPDPASDLDR